MISASQLQDRALQVLLSLGLQARHPSLSAASIIKVSPEKSLTIQLPVIEFVEAGGVSQKLLEQTCQVISRASWQMNEDPMMAVEDVSQGNSYAHHSSLPDIHENLLIKATVKKSFDTLPTLTFRAGVLRNDEMMPILEGGSLLFCPNRPYSRRPVDQGIQAVPPSRAPIAPLCLPLPVVSVASESSFVNPESLSCCEIPLVDEPRIEQKYMYLSVCPKETELHNALKKIGINPIHVAFSDLRFIETKVVYYFNVSTDREKVLVESNFFDEHTWSTKFNKEHLQSDDAAFLTLAMPVKEIYRTMLVASRLYADKAPFVDRQQAVSDRQQLRRAFRNKSVMSIRDRINETGSKILRQLRTEVGM